MIDNNLNFEHILTDDTRNGQQLKDYSLSISNIDIYFRNLEERLVDLIKEADFVFGCIAWLTNSNIIEALSELEYGCAIVVQKEDFLRPDIEKKGDWNSYLRRLYNKLHSPGELWVFGDSIGSLLGSLDTSCTPSFDPVRCVGNYNRDKKPAFPRMHNKFLIFGKWDGDWELHHQAFAEWRIEIDNYLSNGGRPFDEVHSRLHQNLPQPPQPMLYKIWTGSFNFTKNATASLENAVVIDDRVVANAFFNEFSQIYAISESLDWRHEWIAPEYRIGT